MFYKRIKAQSTLEYVILIGFVVAALIAMGVYMKRGVQGKIRDSSDQIGGQYDAKDTSSEYITKTYIKQNEYQYKGGGSKTEIADNNPENYKIEKKGSETVEKDLSIK
ncbi:MAG: hypothetical protein WC543_00935 [Candidatus Omnitrophota bacterium]